MEQLFEIQRIIFEEFIQKPFYSRELFSEITLDNRICGVVGGRGIGKTTLLLRLAIDAGAKQRRALYASADNVWFLENRLIDLVDQLYKETDVRLLCIDEIHKYPNWNQELKNIADTYLDFKVLFSGSSTIDLLHSKFDLSRRVTLYELHGLSFREYLELHLDIQLPKFSLDDLVESHLSIAQELPIRQVLKQFHEYLRVGYYPFFHSFTQDREKFQAIENATQKTIYEDIGTLHALRTPTLLLIEQLFKFVIHSSPGELSAYKLAKNLGKDFDSVASYLRWLQEAGLIRMVYPNKTGNAYLRSPAKMYPDNPNLIHAAYLPLIQDSAVGKERETFVVGQLQNAYIPTYYHTEGDFRVNDMIFEVGGRGKTTKQIKNVENSFVLADGILVGSKRKIPLYLLGFLY